MPFSNIPMLARLEQSELLIAKIAQGHSGTKPIKQSAGKQPVCRSGTMKY